MDKGRSLGKHAMDGFNVRTTNGLVTFMLCFANEQGAEIYQRPKPLRAARSRCDPGADQSGASEHSFGKCHIFT